MTLGENVKALREAKDLTYDAVGSAVGTDGQNIFNLEKRKSKVSRFAPALAQFFNVDLDVLMARDLTKMSRDEILELTTKGQTKRPLMVVESTANGYLSSAEAISRLVTLYMRSTDAGRQGILDAAEVAPKAVGDRDAANDETK
jgi:transcriptional regulator with XRE-family HTH domain